MMCSQCAWSVCRPGLEFESGMYEDFEIPSQERYNDNFSNFFSMMSWVKGERVSVRNSILNCIMRVRIFEDFDIPNHK
jgi:hypothetical protein